MQRETTASNRTRTLLILDIAMFVAFLIAMAPRFSGLAIHEWLSIAFGAAIVTHLLLNWQWLAGVTRRLFGTLQWSARISYLLNALLFIDMTVIIFTGLMISEAALPTLGIHLPHGFTWRRLHDLSANFSLLLIGLHLALHWDWIVGAVRRLVTRRAPRQEPGVPLRSPVVREEV